MKAEASPLTYDLGDNWKEAMGECDKDRTFEILDYFYENGGNFLDTGTTPSSE